MRDSFNRMLHNFPNQFGRISLKAVAVEYTHLDKIAVTITPPSAASVIVDDEDMTEVIIKWARKKYDVSEEEEIEVTLDNPWHRVVIHGIPMAAPCSGMSSEDAWKSILKEWVAFNPLAPGIEHMARSAPLIPEAAVRDGSFLKYESISWCLAFREKKHVDWFLRNGMYIHGKHCRTSLYKPRGS